MVVDFAVAARSKGPFSLIRSAPGGDALRCRARGRRLIGSPQITDFTSLRVRSNSSRAFRSIPFKFRHSSPRIPDDVASLLARDASKGLSCWVSCLQPNPWLSVWDDCVDIHDLFRSIPESDSIKLFVMHVVCRLCIFTCLLSSGRPAENPGADGARATQAWHLQHVHLQLRRRNQDKHSASSSRGYRKVRHLAPAHPLQQGHLFLVRDTARLTDPDPDALPSSLRQPTVCPGPRNPPPAPSG